MKNGRCRLHGGKSTGAKTEEGKQKRDKANYKNGLYTKDMFYTRALMKSSRNVSKMRCAEAKDSVYHFTGSGDFISNMLKFKCYLAGF